MDNRPKTTRRTLDLIPNIGEMIKPAELIDISGAGHLTLSARRLYNLLIAHAFGPDMADENSEWEIPIAQLRGTHDSNDRLDESILALMKSVVTVRLPNGDTRRVQLLGGNDLSDSDRRHGYLRYAFDRRLLPLLRDSRIFGILELRVMASFTSRYALTLYEALTRRVRMERVSETFNEAALRDLLAVPDGKLRGVGNLRKFAIKPATEEINGLAPFNVRIEDIKSGRRVVGFQVWWWRKTPEEYRAALTEIERPRAGRSVRIRGSAEPVVKVGSIDEED